jgi:hypothetical protein
MFNEESSMLTAVLKARQVADHSGVFGCDL